MSYLPARTALQFMLDEKLNTTNAFTDFSEDSLGSVHAFHCESTPRMPISAYLAQIDTCLFCGPETFVIAAVYLGRATSPRIDQATGKQHHFVRLDARSVHRLVLTCIVIANKWLNEVTYTTQANFAHVGGVTRQDLNYMELQLLCVMDFRLFVSEVQFEMQSCLLLRQMLFGQNKSGIFPGSKVAPEIVTSSDPTPEKSQNNHNPRRRPLNHSSQACQSRRFPACSD
eukprot:c39_g1_i1.p1 GENE.c39_g1_i1~~c39_g1_i1.p1  ORF type:complete len:261 (-),score=58.58 c39_g1_i1:137-820(-)